MPGPRGDLTLQANTSELTDRSLAMGSVSVRPAPTLSWSLRVPERLSVQRLRGRL